MLKGKKIFIILLAVLILTSCTFGGDTNNKDIENKGEKPADIKTPEPEQIVELIVDCFDKKDYKDIKELYNGDMSDEQLEEHIGSIESVLTGKLEDYKRVGVQKSTRIYNGTKTVEQGYSYSVKTSDNDYIINIMLMGSSSDDMKLVGFNVIASQKEEKDFI